MLTWNVFSPDVLGLLTREANNDLDCILLLLIPRCGPPLPSFV